MLGVHVRFKSYFTLVDMTFRANFSILWNILISTCCLCSHTKILGKRTEFSCMIFAIPSNIWNTSGIQILRISALINMLILCMEAETLN